MTGVGDVVQEEVAVERDLDRGIEGILADEKVAFPIAGLDLYRDPGADEDRDPVEDRRLPMVQGVHHATTTE